MTDWVEIDGLHGEGGGQILRTSLSLAAVTGKPVRISNIRANRKNPGLANQHLAAVRAAARICGGELRGDKLGSRFVELTPKAVRAGAYEFDVAAERGSAGSTGLVLQTVLPPLLMAGRRSEITVRGGTSVPWSPGFEYLRHVFAPCLAWMGASVGLQRPRAGFYPHGGGVVKATAKLEGGLGPLRLVERGEIVKIVVHSVVSDRLPEHIGPRQIEGCREALGEGGVQVRDVEGLSERPPSGGPGTSVCAAVWFEEGFGGCTAIGERGVSAEKVGAQAGRCLADFVRSGAAIDEHLSDQMLLYAALAEGASEWTTPAMTRHLETNADVIREFLPARLWWEQTGEAMWTVRVEPGKMQEEGGIENG
jgi:RNA 3'-terminal phosphate cyclase (ATP)